MSNKTSGTKTEAHFEALIKQYEHFLRRVIIHTCPHNLGIQIADIEQEARIRLWRAIQNERELNEPASYIYRIAVTTTIDAVRRVLARQEDQFPSGEVEADEVSSLPSNPDQSPDRVTERRLLLQKIEAALARLPERRRTAVELYLQGMTTQEIADLLDWTEPKARNLVYRGLSDLRSRLRDEGIEYE